MTSSDRNQILERLAGVCSLVTVPGIGIALTWVFFSGLWSGGGLIGNDVYTYYLPQKAFYADRLQHGEIPLWDNRVGFGYPMVAESQTGAFYPLHLAVYRLMNVNTAYNVNQLIHYVLAFVFVWLYSRKLGTSRWSALLAGLIYTYGWFPPRICLEWTIIGGAWLPAVLLAAECWVHSRRTRFLLLLSLTMALQMLAGHYNLAFITQVTVALYVPARLWFFRAESDFAEASPRAAQSHRKSFLGFLAAVVLAFGVAGIQLGPTLEMMQRSQRSTVDQLIDLGEGYHPRFGSIPLWYYAQIVVPWTTYPPLRTAEGIAGPDDRLRRSIPNGEPTTNKVEAHLYFGLATMLLLAYGILRRALFADRRWILWICFGLAALAYTSGYLVPLTQYLPGFGFFVGPGRYGIVATLAVALLAAAAFDRLLEGFFRRFGRVLKTHLPTRRFNVCLLLTATTFSLLAVDLWLVNDEISPARILERPPIAELDTSQIKQLLNKHEGPVRVFCRTPNVATLMGVSSTPIYLGYGPAEYFTDELTIPEPAPFEDVPTEEQIEWLEQAGVTHMIGGPQLDEKSLPVRQVWSRYDEFFHSVWGIKYPVRVYELANSRGRVSWTAPRPGDSAKVTEYLSNRVVVSADSASGGTLVLTDLAFPGWTVTVDDVPATGRVIDGQFRGVDVPAGHHTVVWQYGSPALRWGGITTLVCLCLLSALVWFGRSRTLPESERRPDAINGPLRVSERHRQQE